MIPTQVQDIGIADQFLSRDVRGEQFTLDSIGDYAAAAGADLFTSSLNSLSPILPDEVWEPQTTYDWLTEKGYVDVARYYAENKDAVELGSFVGQVGLSLLGGGLALRALRLGKLGAMSANPWNTFNQGVYKNKEKMLELIRDAKEGTSAYKKFRAQMLGNSIASGAVEGATYEAALYAMANEHAWMENYDPSLFLLGTGLGAALGGGVKYWQVARDIKQAGGAIQAQQVKAAQVEEYIASKEMYGIENAGHGLAQRGHRIGNRKSQLQSPETQGIARQFLEQQDIQDTRHFLSDVESFVPKGALKKREGGIGRSVGEYYGKDQDLSDVLYRLTAEHPTGAALQGTNKIDWWDKKAVDLFWLQGQTLKSGDDVHEVWRAHQSPKHGPVPAGFESRAVLDPRSGKGGLIWDEATALANVRAADDPAFRLGTVPWRTLPKVSDDLWADGSGIYKLQGTLSADKNAYLTMKATLPGIGATINVTADDIYKLQRLVAEGGDIVNTRKIVVGGQRITSIDDLQQLLRNGKAVVGQRLLAEGYSPPQISTFLNMADNDVDTLIANQWRADTPIESWGLYTKSDKELNEWLTQKQVVFDGEPVAQQRLINQEPLTVMDRADQYNAHNAIVDSVMTNPQTNQKAADLYQKVVNDPGFTDIANNIENFVGQLQVGGRKFTSADFALRELGHFGDFATSIGTRLKNWVNKEVSNLNVGLAPAMREIQADKVQSAIWGQVYRAYTGLPASLARETEWVPGSNAILVRGQPLAVNGTPIQIPAESAVGKWLTEWVRPGGAQESLAGMTDAVKRVKGFGKLSDVQSSKGLYFPYPNLEDKFIAYIHNTDQMAKSKLVIANTEDELEQLVRDVGESLGPNQHVVRRSDATDFAAVHQYHHEVGRLERYDPSQAKRGIQVEGVSPTASSLNEIMEGLHWDINGKARSLVKNSHPYLTDTLERIRNFHNRGAQSSNLGLAQAVRTNALGKDAGTILYNTMFNVSGKADSPLINAANNWFEANMNWGLNKLRGVLANTIGKAPLVGKTLTEKDFDEVVQGLSDARIPNPWRSVDEYLANNYQPYKNLSSSAVNTFNATQAFFNLRALEGAHAMVTLLSYPIAISAGGLPMKHMMNGIKIQMGRDELSRLIRDRATQHGFLDPKDYLFEQSNAYGAALGENKVQKLLNSRMAKVMTAPSDWSEKFVRHQAYFAGIAQALEKDPQMAQRILQQGMKGNMDMGEHIAHGFTIRSMGNYNGTQRPHLFQGSLGNAMMLYQTYMLTMAQNMYKFLEKREYAGLGKLLTTQAGIFGMSTLPFYGSLNKAVGSYVGEDNMDITNMTNRIFGKDGPEERNWAEFILYGAPSALMNTAFSSRAELQPRLPLSMGTDGSVGLIPPGISFLKQTMDLFATGWSELSSTLNAGGNTMDLAEAGRRAIAMQSIWRPARGMAEVTQGYTLDRKGAVIENDAFQEMTNLTRVFGLRPLEEHVLRQTRYMNRYYDAKDADNRRNAVRKVNEWAARPDNGLDLGNVAAAYFQEGGTSRGWTSALNTAFLNANVPLANRLQKEITKQPLLDDIVNSYIY